MKTYPVTDSFGLTYQIEGHSYADALQIAKSMNIDYLIDLNEIDQELPANSVQAPAKQDRLYTLHILNSKDMVCFWTCSAKSEKQAHFFWSRIPGNSYTKSHIIYWSVK